MNTDLKYIQKLTLVLFLLLGSFRYYPLQSLVLLYEFLLQLNRARRVPAVLHAVLSPALRGRSQLPDVAKHLIERHFGVDGHPSFRSLRAIDYPVSLR